MTTNLDKNQVIRNVYDEANNRLRTDASLTASSITVDVTTSEADDTIQVYGNDGANNQPIRTNADGRLEVVAPPVGIVNKVRNDYTGTPVTTGAYVQLIASTASAIRRIEIFDSSGETLVLATGAPASEVEQLYIVPGGNGVLLFDIPAGARVAIKAVSANAVCGEIVLNCYNN
jgi:hypothetical protein